MSEQWMSGIYRTPLSLLTIDNEEKRASESSHFKPVRKMVNAGASISDSTQTEAMGMENRGLFHLWTSSHRGPRNP
jgi:hypothetical protein